MFDLGIRRSREVKNNLRARRREAEALAESSYPLRSLGRFAESRQRIESAFALLRETSDYPAERLNPESEVVFALRARADYQAQATPIAPWKFTSNCWLLSWRQRPIPPRRI
jgi:hypothetical protein